MSTEHTAAQLDGPEPSPTALASTERVYVPPSGIGIATAAADYVGVREATGHNDGPEVEYFLAQTGLPSRAKWCGAFAYTAHVEAGLRPPGAPSAYAWSPTWFSTPSRLVAVDQCAPGDVMGIHFPSLGRIAHIGVVESRSGSTITTIEGNTNDVNSREGDGVYRKYRKAGTVKATARWW